MRIIYSEKNLSCGSCDNRTVLWQSSSKHSDILCWRGHFHSNSYILQILASSKHSGWMTPMKSLHLSKLNNDLQLPVERYHHDKIREQRISNRGVSNLSGKEHFNEEFRIRSHDTPTRSTFDASQNFKVVIFVYILPALNYVWWIPSYILVLTLYMYFGTLHMSVISLNHDITDWNQYLQDAKNSQPEELDESDSSQSSDDRSV